MADKEDNDIPIKKEGQTDILIKKEGQTDILIKKEGQTMSKRQMKRLARKQKWEETKFERRKREKEIKKRKRMEAKAAGITTSSYKITKMTDTKSNIKVAIDMSFDSLMTELELGKCINQLQRCYSLNRRKESPVHLHITSYANTIKKAMEANQGCKNWDLHFKEENYVSAFGKENCVYLTSESPNVLKELDPSKVYIIGGLVDHNRFPGICFDNAIKNEIGHARLPIDDYVILKTRKVLTIDQVFLILLKVANKTSWQDALVEVIPERKGAVRKEVKHES